MPESKLTQPIAVLVDDDGMAIADLKPAAVAAAAALKGLAIRIWLICVRMHNQAREQISV